VHTIKVTIPHLSHAFDMPFKYMSMELAVADIQDYIYGLQQEPILSLVSTFKELCKGVFRLHGRQIYHRDIKPDAFLVCEDDSVKVGDFGTAADLNNGARILPDYWTPVGNRTYAAPETFFRIGVHDEDCCSSDIYSLGSVLFEMVTKTELSTLIISPALRHELSLLGVHMSLAPQSQQRVLFEKSIEKIASSHRLPNIYEFNNIVPGCIKVELNNLYRSMCNLDYRRRIIDYQSIHRQLDICILQLKNKKKEDERRRYKRLNKEKLLCLPQR
jgi:serine/threonine protein kinase